MKKIFSAVLTASLAITAAPATAQQELQLRVLNVLGEASLLQDGYGCFDPLAALYLDKDIVFGVVSGAVRQFFEVGSCVKLQQDVTLTNVQRISLEGQIIIRGAFPTAEVTVYIPNWSAALGDTDSGYEMGRVAIAAPLDAVAADLRARVNASELCLRDGETLDARIIDYNERVAAIPSGREEATTGSRLKSGSTATPVFTVVLSDEKHRALRDEGLALQDAVKVYLERCADRGSITLDQDYLAYYHAGI